MDVSFSGILTSIEKIAKEKLPSGEVTKADLCYSLVCFIYITSIIIYNELLYYSLVCWYAHGVLLYFFCICIVITNYY